MSKASCQSSNDDSLAMNRTRYPEGDYGAPKGFPTRDEQTPAIVCGDDAKIVIHNVKAPDDMRFLGEVAKNCSSAGLA